MHIFLIGIWSFVFLFSGCSNVDVQENTSVLQNVKAQPIVSLEQSQHSNGDEDVSVMEINATIDVLVVLDANLSDTEYHQTLLEIRHAVELANVVFRNSRLPLQLQIVGKTSFLFQSSSMEKSLLETSKDEEIAILRDMLKADIVVSFRPYLRDGSCGVAYVNGALSDKFAYAQVALGCPSVTMVHEIGHVMGLVHSEKEKTKGYARYARGYGIDGEFVTIMAYAHRYGAAKKAFVFSSPELECDGYPCGVDLQLQDGADAVSALYQTATVVSAFR